MLVNQGGKSNGYNNFDDVECESMHVELKRSSGDHSLRYIGLWVFILVLEWTLTKPGRHALVQISSLLVMRLAQQVEDYNEAFFIG